MACRRRVSGCIRPALRLWTQQSGQDSDLTKISGAFCSSIPGGMSDSANSTLRKTPGSPDQKTRVVDGPSRSRWLWNSFSSHPATGERREVARRYVRLAGDCDLRAKRETCWVRANTKGDKGQVLAAEQASPTPSEFQSRRSHLPLREKGRLRVDSNTRSRFSILGPQIACQTSLTTAHLRLRNMLLPDRESERTTE